MPRTERAQQVGAHYSVLAFYSGLLSKGSKCAMSVSRHHCCGQIRDLVNTINVIRVYRIRISIRSSNTNTHTTHYQVTSCNRLKVPGSLQ